VVPAAGHPRLGGARALAVALVAAVSLAACAGQPPPRAAAPPRRELPARPVTPARTTPAPAPAPAAGIPGGFRVAQRQVTFVEPGHPGAAGAYLGPRTLVTRIRYPVAGRASGPRPPRGGFPLILFGPGFMQCGGPYSDLLQAWASAGYVVAVVNFPQTDCRMGARAYEPDLVNQPADMSYVLSRLLALNAQPGDPFSGLVNGRQIAAAGQSDGGDTVAALAASTCCADHRVRAVAVLSGAEWPPMPGRYFAHGAPPMLFVQGSADAINPPWASLQLYRLDQDPVKYYLDLFGANHLVPYWGTNPVERLVARVTLAFFNRYVLGQAPAAAAMTRDGNVSGTAALVSGSRLPP
jgi:dienelactone hydrolase